MPGEPLDQEIEAPATAGRADASAPRWPSPHEVAQAQETPDLSPRGVIQQASCSPVAIEAPHRLLARQQGAEAGLIDVVVPDVREPLARPARALRLAAHGITVPPGPARGPHQRC